MRTLISKFLYRSTSTEDPSTLVGLPVWRYGLVIFMLLMIFCSQLLALQIKPENPFQFDNILIENVVISMDQKTNLDPTIFLTHTKIKEKFYTTYLINDIGNMLKSGQIQDISTEIKLTKQSRVEIIFNIKITPTIRYIEISDLSIYKASFFLPKLSNKVNEPVNYATISNDIKIIEKAYHENGYILAKVTNVFFVKNLQTLIFSVEEGKIHKLEFPGLNKISRQVVEREVYSKPGKVLNITEVNKDRNRIFSTGYFSKVSAPRILPSSEKPGNIDILYSVSERKINNLQIGLEQLQNNKLSLALAVKLPNFRNSGEGLYFKGQGIIDKTISDYSYYFRYTDPWFLSRSLPLNISFWHQINEETDSNSNSTSVQRNGWETNVELPFFEDFSAVMAYRAEFVKDVPGNYTPYNKNSTKLKLLFNTVKASNNPLTGSKAYFEFEKGNNIMQLINMGGIDFNKYLFDYSIFFNIYKKDVLALRFNGGVLNYFDSTSQLFEQDKFKVGGTYSLRGYPESYADPTNAIIGNKKVLINGEYRIMFNDWLQGVLFIDWGYATDNTMDTAKFKIGRGAGFRIFTPLAPLRFDFALGEDNEFILHFGLGQLF